MNKIFVNRKDRECPDCNGKEWAYQGLFYRVGKKEVCYQCYYRDYSTPEEIEINNM